ncbi:aminoglycoside phosphotransferase family protein [Paenibacillus rhizovicinus]|uniref:Aminoglycoside phosphotransferase family protein n=1 Tax=Paenibacillus rhizovicinus TaxID=2704463 RepID=A0A6C0P7D5_9BACL|nr:aminoglycoside phosphotransferase family protein [Paenibacillus rhizovicinus]QHW34306.1 aminoglycoside phosphotransferase family protein [Paenibacillus rhizovicinus]
MRRYEKAGEKMEMMKAADIPLAILDLIGPVNDVRQPKQGHTSTVGHVIAKEGEFIVKRCDRPPYRDWLRKEHRNLLLLQSSGLPVPRVLSFCDEDESGASWLVTSYIEGIRLREFLAWEKSAAKRERAIHSYGAFLRAIHVAAPPAELAGQDDWLGEMLRQSAFDLAHYEVDGTADLLEELRWARPAPVTNTLIHGDFTIDNVLVCQDAVVGAIDWGGAAVGDPRYDIALAIRPKTNAFEQAADIELFYEAFGLRRISEQEYNYFEGGLYAFF